MVKKYIKRLKKMPLDFQFRFIEAISMIERGDFKGLDIIEISGKQNYFRCRLGKFRIIFYKDNFGDYIIEDIGSRGDIYK